MGLENTENKGDRIHYNGFIIFVVQFVMMLEQWIINLGWTPEIHMATSIVLYKFLCIAQLPILVSVKSKAVEFSNLKVINIQ